MANVGHPHHDKEWIQQALCEDQQAAGLLPPKLPGGAILHGARARAECTYQDRKWAVDKLWEHKHHHLLMAAHQRHLDEKAACKKQEAAHRQCLPDKRAANKRQEAAHKEAAGCQHLLEEEAAHCIMAECAALAQQMAAA
jgi:hypothetical protein